MRTLAISVLMILAACKGPPPFESADLPSPARAGHGPAVVELLKDRKETVLQALSQNRNPADAVGALGLAHQAFNARAEALTCYQLAVSADPANPRWWYLLGTIQKRMANLEAAHQAFVKVLELQPDHGPSLLETAEYQRQAHDLDQARALFEMALKHRPQSVAALAGLAKIAISGKDFQKALQLLDEAQKHQPEAKQLYYLQAMAFRGLGETEKAAEAMNGQARATAGVTREDLWLADLEALENRHIQYLDKGDASADGGDLEAALKHYAQALAFQPRHYEAATKHAWALLETGRLEQALAAYQTTLELRSDNAVVYYNIGGLQGALGRDKTAVLAFREALKFNPDMAISQLFLADALRRLQQWDEAREAYEKAIEMDDDEVAARLGRVLMLIRQDAHDQALKTLNQDLKIMPGQKVLLLTAARLLAASPQDKLRNGMRAVSLVEPLVKGAPHVDTAETIAMVMAEAGRMDLAVKYQSQALGLAQNAGLKGRYPFLEANLARYRANQPCRTPWPNNDPIFSKRTYKGSSRF